MGVVKEGMTVRNDRGDDDKSLLLFFVVPTDHAYLTQRNGRMSVFPPHPNQKKSRDFERWREATVMPAVFQKLNQSSSC